MNALPRNHGLCHAVPDAASLQITAVYTGMWNSDGQVNTRKSASDLQIIMQQIYKQTPAQCVPEPIEVLVKPLPICEPEASQKRGTEVSGKL